MKEFDIRSVALDAAIRLVTSRVMDAEPDDFRAGTVLRVADRFAEWLQGDDKGSPEEGGFDVFRREYQEAMSDPDHACSDLSQAIPGCSCIDLYERAYPNGATEARRETDTDPRTEHADAVDQCSACSHPEHASERCPHYGCVCLTSRTRSRLASRTLSTCAYCEHAEHTRMCCPECRCKGSLR